MDKSTGTISIAMEFCEGGSLDSIYKEVKKLGGRTGEKVLGKVAEGVLNGLTYLHSRKIIHRGSNHSPTIYIDHKRLIFSRHQTIEHSLMPWWQGQTLRLWCQRWIRYQGRRQHLHWHFLLYGPRAHYWSIIHHYIRRLVSRCDFAGSRAAPIPFPCWWDWDATPCRANRSPHLYRPPANS